MPETDLPLPTTAIAGSVLVVDNGGRTDEACVGDLITLEAKSTGWPYR